MSRAARLEPLADYAGKVETGAARRLAASAEALKVKEKEVEQLRGYLAEYRQRAALADAATDPLRWQNARAFLAKLSEVVAARETELKGAVERYRPARRLGAAPRQGRCDPPDGRCDARRVNGRHYLRPRTPRNISDIKILIPIYR